MTSENVPPVNVSNDSIRVRISLTPYEPAYAFLSGKTPKQVRAWTRYALNNLHVLMQGASGSNNDSPPDGPSTHSMTAPKRSTKKTRAIAGDEAPRAAKEQESTPPAQKHGQGLPPLSFFGDQETWRVPK